MRLDVVVPTYKREALLRLTLESLVRATVPAGLEVRVLVVDNNSVDGTEAMVRAFATQATLAVEYVRETRQGSSQTRNAGIAAGTGELIGFVDDDEEIEEHWFEVIAREFADPATEFVGGPYLPKWVTAQPPWLPPGYHAAIGAVPPKPRSVFGDAFGANLMGGNAVIRRSVFERVGLYAAHLGRGSTGLGSEEDVEFLRRMLRAGVRGVYVPDLAIRHYIAPERLTRRYHRRWVYGRAVSQGVLDREVPEPVTYLLGVPRHKFGRALRGLLRMPWRWLRREGAGVIFSDELAVWDLAGFVYGKHFVRVPTQ